MWVLNSDHYGYVPLCNFFYNSYISWIFHFCEQWFVLGKRDPLCTWVNRNFTSPLQHATQRMLVVEVYHITFASATPFLTRTVMCRLLSASLRMVSMIPRCSCWKKWRMDTLCRDPPSSLTNTGGCGIDHMIYHVTFMVICMVLSTHSTILVEPGCNANITLYGDIRIQVGFWPSTFDLGSQNNAITVVHRLGGRVWSTSEQNWTPFSSPFSLIDSWVQLNRWEGTCTICYTTNRCFLWEWGGKEVCKIQNLRDPGPPWSRTFMTQNWRVPDPVVLLPVCFVVQWLLQLRPDAAEVKSHMWCFFFLNSLSFSERTSSNWWLMRRFLRQ